MLRLICECGSGFAHVNARSKIPPFRLSAPEDFLWQYVHSTPLGAAVAQLDEEVRAALQYEVVAAWQQFHRRRYFDSSARNHNRLGT